jgi:transmembrane sensor
MWVAGMVAIVAAVFAIVRRTPYDDGSLARTYATPIGRQAIITLDDSTRVVLSPNTIIRLVHLNQRSRIVRLERGAAHFTVVHASGAPFLVQSDIASARVLGTEFLVSRDPARAQVHVAVERGKVLVSLARMSDTGVTLTAGQVSDVTDSSNHVSAIGDVAPSAEWTPGHLWFRHTAVATILQTLSRWYGYQFRYSDSTLAQRNVTIGLSTQSGTTALSTIAQVLAVNVAVVGDTVTLTPQRVQPLPSMPRARTYDVWTPTKEVGR